MEKRAYGLNSFQLKCIALIVMIVVHSTIAFGEWSPLLQPISRFVSPLFAFLMVEGFFYTSSRKKYIVRLLGVGVVVYIGNLLVGALTGKTMELASHTIILTLALAFCVMWMLDTAIHSTKKAPMFLLFAIVYVVAIVGGMFLVEGALQVVNMTLIFYIFRNRRGWMFAAIFAFSAFLGWLSFPMMDGVVDWNTFLTFGSDWMQFLVIPFICLYNGEPGPKTAFSKWMFYVGYPLHLWVFAAIGMLLGS